MTVEIAATVTTDGADFLARYLGGIATPKVLNLFKVGEGGWIDPGTGAVPRTPDPNLRRVDNSIQDIDAVVDATRPVSQQRYTTSQRGAFSKALAGGDLTMEAPGILRVSVFLDFGEFNDDGFGNSPDIWEVGVFSDHPTVGGQKLLVGYGTMPKVTKTGGIQVQRFMRLLFKKSA